MTPKEIKPRVKGLMQTPKNTVHPTSLIITASILFPHQLQVIAWLAVTLFSAWILPRIVKWIKKAIKEWCK